MKNKRKSSYIYIDSFHELDEEKTRLQYEVKLSKRKLDMAVMELSAVFSPIRLVSAAVSEWLNPVSVGIRKWLENFVMGRSRR